MDVKPVGLDEHMSSLKPTKSYDKVYVLLAKTPECRAVWEEIVSTYSSLKLLGYKFSVHTARDYSLHINIGDTFLGGQDGFYMEEALGEVGWRFGCANIRKPYEDALYRAAWDHLVTLKDVPTYNVDPMQVVGAGFCKKIGMYPGKEKAEKLDRSRQSTFKNWFIDQFDYSNSPFRNAVFSSIRAELELLKGTQEFKDRLRDSIVDQCMKDVAVTLGKYSTLGEDTLKKAIQNFVVEDTLGT
jgi:hypothetical protein